MKFKIHYSNYKRYNVGFKKNNFFTVFINSPLIGNGRAILSFRISKL